MQRPPSHAWRKLLSVALVVVALSVGLVGVGLAVDGRPWGLALCVLTPFGIWGATRILPPAGTTAYLDRNL
jgi:hypothetical protein